MSSKNGQFFPRLEAVLKEYGEAMHYTDLARLVEIPEKNVCTALAHHTRQHPLGTVRRIKRGTYLYVGTPRARLAKVKEAEAAAEALPRRIEPLPVDQPPLFKGAVTQAEIDAKTHPAQRVSVPQQLNTFGDSLTPEEREKFREAAGLVPGNVHWDGIDRVGDKLSDATIAHINVNDGDREIFFTWRGKMWKAYEL